MDLSTLKDYGCEGIIGDGFHLVYDESHLAICNKKEEKIIFRINELYRLRKMLEQAETAMLENYKLMSFDQKAAYCKYHEIKYKDMQMILTLRGE